MDETSGRREHVLSHFILARSSIFLSFGIGMTICHFYTKMNPLRDAERSHTLLESRILCERIFFDIIDLKIRDLFPT